MKNVYRPLRYRGDLFRAFRRFIYGHRRTIRDCMILKEDAYDWATCTAFKWKNQGVYSMEYIAHKANNSDQTQTLFEHSINVSNIASSFSNDSTIKASLEFCGLFHDFGKYTDKFQRRINGENVTAPHSIWGAWIAYKLGHLKEEALCILSHHTGLYNMSKSLENYNGCQDKKEEHILLECYQKFLKENPQWVPSKIKEHPSCFTGKSPLETDILIRLIFSALIDADRLDTASFCNQKEPPQPSNIDIDFCLEKIKSQYQLLSQKNNPLNNLRNQVREYALTKANNAAGFFSLTLPTGMGKTLTSFYWALEHAKTNQFKRIIIVLPFINIIDQTAKELKDIFGENYILEHHSGFKEAEEKEDGTTLQPELENWDAPIIVTTTVQFFESLFSNKTSQCRKLHNIQDSVVIFDEVQSLDKEIALPTIDMLKDLQKIFHCSFLFCTATQPAFQKRSDFDGIEHIESLVEDPENLFKKTKRVNYNLVNNLDAISSETLLSHIISQRSSCVVVVNAKLTAKNIFDSLKSSPHSFQKIYHLSTNMCAHHRKKVIAEIKQALKEDKSICLVSTQLIEAGVDLDFSTAYRETGPLSSIIQTAGRCNREGKREKGDVYVFELEIEKCPLGIYKDEKNFTKNKLKLNPDILESATGFTQYYAEVVHLFTDKKKQKQITENRKALTFEDVANQYKLINADTEPVLVNYQEEACQILLNELRKKCKYVGYLKKEDYRRMQPYLVMLYPQDMEKIKPYCENLNFDEGKISVRVYHDYDKEFGIKINKEASDFII